MSHLTAPWQAQLALQFTRQDGRTALTRREHTGPLMVQKALYPEGPGVCHVAILHPPGGIAAGDRLAIDAQLSARSQALLTTPGATKWYRSLGEFAAQTLRFTVAPGAALEWLPRENIFFDASQAAMSLEVRLAEDAQFLGWEILCFGRRASGERWTRGRLRLDTRVLRDGRLLWSELADLAAEGGFAHSPVGLAGASVCATLIAAGRPPDADVLGRCRAVPLEGGEARGGITWMSEVLVARYLGYSSEQAFHWFTALWSVLRPALSGRAAQAPRLWAT